MKDLPAKDLPAKDLPAKDLPAKDLPAYVLDRVFDAPRELVWRAWTDPKLLPRWYGPNMETIVHGLDLKPGGLWLVEMKWSGKSSYQRIEYMDVTPPERLVWLHSNSERTGMSHHRP
jgi:uncharacterized protein YndB with AHSA1/START domain